MHMPSTQPLLVRSQCSRMLYEFLPVGTAASAVNVPDGAVSIRLHEDDALRVRKYLHKHDAAAVSEQGEVAFTLRGQELVQCRPIAPATPASSNTATW